jgi:hypothetical protein
MSLRFKWINWNLFCNTTAQAVTQTISPRTTATSLEVPKSAFVLQPPHPSARRSIGTRTACLRAHRNRRAMGAGTHTHAKAGETEVAR